MLDAQRLQTTLGRPELAWLVERLEEKLERGRELTGTVTLRSPSPAQRSATDRLLGRSPSRGSAVSVRLEELERTLQNGELCKNLREAVEILVGPVANLRDQRRRSEKAWQEMFAEAISRHTSPEWIFDLQQTGLLRRLSNNNAMVAGQLLKNAADVLAALPCLGVPLAEFAGRVTGDSHALDPGRPLGTLVVRAVARQYGLERWDDAQGRREAWDGVGVVVDELSSTVLVLNLPSVADSITDRALNAYAAAGEPCRLTVRQLLRYPPSFNSSETDRVVYVCENPTVIAAAANRLGADSRPLVCIEGQPKTAARLLLNRLTEAGLSLLYHGDFDWAGIRIANLIISRHAARTWRFTGDDYRSHRGMVPLTGAPIAASWDSTLMATMIAEDRAVHEEQVLDTLLQDLSMS